MPAFPSQISYLECIFKGKKYSKFSKAKLYEIRFKETDGDVISGLECP